MINHNNALLGRIWNVLYTETDLNEQSLEDLSHKILAVIEEKEDVKKETRN